ncbi:MAG TPA: PIN domain-containing protein [Spirochaetota bacterium]|nr:PIN domain-containing protein [Spirochaetota bacterium]
MKEKIFIDTDVILDVALKRDEFGLFGALIFDNIEKGIFEGFTSSIIINNIYYIQRKIESREKAINFIKKLIKLIKVLDVDEDVIKKALDSEMKDFEDSIQNEVALKNNIETIITRNTADYKKSKLKIYTSEEFVNIKIRK